MTLLSRRLTAFVLTTAIGAAPMLTLAAEVRFGFRGGYNLATAETNVPVVELTKSDRPSYHFGALVDIALNEKWSIQPQLLYSGKGVTFEAPDHGHVISMYAFELPIYVIRRFDSGFLSVNSLKGQEDRLINGGPSTEWSHDVWSFSVGYRVPGN